MQRTKRLQGAVQIHSLRSQLTIVILAVLMLGLGLMLLLAGVQMSRYTMEAFEREQQTLALVIANHLAEPLEHARIQEIAASWPGEKAMASNVTQADVNISAFAANGELLVASDGSMGDATQYPDVIAAFKGMVTSYSANNTLCVAVPIVYNSREVLGAVRIITPLDGVNTSLQGRWLILFAAAVGALLLAAAAASWLAARIVSPLSDIQRVAQQMAAGRLDARVEVVTTAEELDSLGKAFNHMADQIGLMMTKQRDFVANASHELRSPLTTIKLRAEALASGGLDAARSRQYAVEINEETNQMADLISELLQLSRTERGSFTAPTEPIHVADELNACVRTVRSRSTVKHQQLDVHIPDDLPEVYMQPNDLRLMVGNLLDNAVKYTPEGGCVGLTARWAGDALLIEVNDSGEGIPPADLPRVTERFFRVDRAHRHSTPGFGLGLALVVATAEQYGGTLTLDSDGIAGSGTRARLALHPAR